MNREAVGLSEPERDLMRQALGLDRCRVSYRNYYAVSPTSNEYVRCLSLVNRGLMERGVPDGGLVVFHVTEAGRAAVRT